MAMCRMCHTSKALIVCVAEGFTLERYFWHNCDLKKKKKLPFPHRYPQFLSFLSHYPVSIGTGTSHSSVMNWLKEVIKLRNTCTRKKKKKKVIFDCKVTSIVQLPTPTLSS